jgi:type IV pilus assembly protein PilM
MKRSRFYKFFPTPAYLRMPAVGIDVSDHTIRYVELVEGKKGFSVKRWGVRDLPVGTIQSGEIVKRAELVSALSTLKEELGFYYVHAPLPEEKAYLFTTEIPRVSKNEIRGAIELLLEENVPIKPTEAIFDYEIVKTESQDHYDVSVSVLPDTVVQNYFSVYEEAGLVPLVFIVDAQATAEAVVKKDDEKTYFIVNVGSARTTLSIVGQGVVYFTSTVALGGDSLTLAFEKQLHLEKKEANERKKKDGLIGSKSNMELFFSLMSSLSVLRDEMNRLAGYWNNLKRSKTQLPEISEIVFSGVDASLPGFIEYFSLVMEYRVRLANVWSNIYETIEGAVPPIPFEESLDYATAIGLSLPKTD